ncbi:alanine racemase [Planctomicrobium sp. SH668]|uniref:alanine racemase n=1 Tax=Planctomicrobium sp. SH668 TaxID=3448126 RepID=UPI003F5BB6F1
MDSDLKYSVIGQHQIALHTPALCVDLAKFETWSAQHSQTLLTLPFEWRIDLPAASLPYWERLSTHQAVHLSVSTIQQASGVQPDRVASLFLTRPPLHDTHIQLLVEQAQQFPVVVACDHYVHAAAISRLANAAGIRIPVAIEVNLDQRRFGVRPGWDGLELAKGVQRLRGVELCGLSADLRGAGENFARQFARLNEVLAELKFHLEVAGFAAPMISVAVDQAATIENQQTPITEIRTFDLLRGSDLKSELRSPFKFIGTVFSRSKLERAVLDIGWEQLGMAAANDRIRVCRSARGRALPDVKILEVGADYIALELGLNSTDLVIGDKVEVEVCLTDLPAGTGFLMYAVREERVVDVFSAIP